MDATGTLLRAASAQAFEKAEVDFRLLKKMCANNPTSKACLQLRQRLRRELEREEPSA